MIIFEGANGVGKTSYAQLLSGRLGAPVYRAFRGNGAAHFGDEVEAMRRLGVPANTFVDDIYMADMARVLDQEIILDRSMPSAIVYGTADGANDIDEWWARLHNWEQRLKRSVRPVLLVWLIARYDVAVRRMTGYKPDSTEYRRLEDMYAACLSRIGMATLCLDTSNVPISDGVGVIFSEREQLAKS